jgi:hypothetical protein
MTKFPKKKDKPFEELSKAQQAAILKLRAKRENEKIQKDFEKNDKAFEKLMDQITRKKRKANVKRHKTVIYRLRQHDSRMLLI